MTQTNLLNWNLINDQIAKSNIKRVNWEKILGKTLTEEITEHRLKGIKTYNIFKMIKSKLLCRGYDDLDLIRRLKISVSARVGEQKAYNNRGKKNGRI